MNLGKSLKIALIKKGMKQNEFAEKIGVSKQQVTNWVTSGKMSQGRLVDICKELDIPVSKFIELGEVS